MTYNPPLEYDPCHVVVRVFIPHKKLFQGQTHATNNQRQKEQYEAKNHVSAGNSFLSTQARATASHPENGQPKKVIYRPGNHP